MVTVSDQFVTVYNRSDRPALLDAEGHTLGGGEYGTARENDPAVQLAFDTGSLGVVEDPGGDLSGLLPEAVAAFEATRAANAASAPRTQRKSVTPAPADDAASGDASAETTKGA
jgi:hypothetical protein